MKVETEIKEKVNLKLLINLNKNFMKNKITRNLIICLTLFSLYSCEKEINTELNSTNQDLIINSLDYNSSLEIMSEIHQSTKEFVNSKKKQGFSENHEKFIEEYWKNNNELLHNLSSKMGLEVNLTQENISQFEYHSKTETDFTEDDIINSVFLNDIQKKYALNLYFALEDENISELIKIKNDFKEEISIHSELEIFNLGIAMIDYNESEGIFNLASKGDCYHAFMVGATMGGLAGLLGGMVKGGLVGFTIGGILTGGTLAIPAGIGGAMVGGVVGALTGYVSGGFLGLFGCLIYG